MSILGLNRLTVASACTCVRLLALTHASPCAFPSMAVQLSNGKLHIILVLVWLTGFFILNIVKNTRRNEQSLGFSFPYLNILTNKFKTIKKRNIIVFFMDAIGFKCPLVVTKAPFIYQGLVLVPKKAPY